MDLDKPYCRLRVTTLSSIIKRIAKPTLAAATYVNTGFTVADSKLFSLNSELKM